MRERDDGSHQLGTLGRGNHFLELQREPDGQLWLMVHSGSRVTRDRLARELHGVYVDPRALGGLREEAPSAYKDIRAVMKSQRELVGVVRTVMPILTHKGVERR